MSQHHTDDSMEQAIQELRDLDVHDAKVALELVAIKRRLARDQQRRDELLSALLSPNLAGEKQWSYRLAAMLSGVSHETLRRRYG